jgi:adenylate cyclase
VARTAKVEELNARWRVEAETAGRKVNRVILDIGIDSGDCSVGNLGSGDRFDYSAVGDSVDMAARIVGLAKRYGVTIVVGEATAARLEAPRAIELDLVKARGRPRPFRLYTLVDAIAADPAALKRLPPAHDRLIAAYRGGDWDGAEAALRECRSLRIEALGTLYSLYRTRIATCREIAPPVDWDGADVAAEADDRSVTDVTPGDVLAGHTKPARRGEG